MPKENKFKCLFGAVSCTALFLLGFVTPPQISPRLQQKLKAAVETTFEITEYGLKPMKISEGIKAKIPLELGDESLFAIEVPEGILGYAYLGQAPSMKNVFDYVVLFDGHLAIKKSKVLIYREDYGRQIGSQRWLKQFIGKKPGDTLEYGEDVDAISGATISAESMTRAVQDVLQGIAMLQENGLLPKSLAHSNN
ncbi:MAG: FMN-binding protein [Bacteroidota bacterium]